MLNSRKSVVETTTARVYFPRTQSAAATEQPLMILPPVRPTDVQDLKPVGHLDEMKTHSLRNRVKIDSDPTLNAQNSRLNNHKTELGGSIRQRPTPPPTTGPYNNYSALRLQHIRVPQDPFVVKIILI